MDFDTFVRDCHGNIIRSLRLSRALPQFCIFSINFNYGIAAVAILLGFLFIQGDGAILSGMFTISFALVLVAIIRNLKRSQLLLPPPPDRLATLPDITDDLEAADRQLLQELCERAGIGDRKLRVLSDLNSPAVAPSITYIAPTFFLILPRDFFSLWQLQPKAAEAMIAHEFGHILQGDVDLYIVFRRYMRFMIGLFIPGILATSVVFFIMGVLIGLIVHGQLDTFTAGAFSYVTSAPIEGVPGAAILNNNGFADYMAYRDYAFAIFFMLILAATSLVLTLFMTFGLVLTFRILNRRSEAVCDSIALALTADDGIKLALSLPGFQHPGRSPLFAPSLPWRREKLERTLSRLRWPSSVAAAPIFVLPSGIHNEALEIEPAKLTLAESLTPESRDILKRAEALGYSVTTQADGTIVVTRDGKGTHFLRTNSQIKLFARLV